MNGYLLLGLCCEGCWVHNSTRRHRWWLDLRQQPCTLLCTIWLKLLLEIVHVAVSENGCMQDVAVDVLKAMKAWRAFVIDTTGRWTVCCSWYVALTLTQSYQLTLLFLLSSIYCMPCCSELNQFFTTYPTDSLFIVMYFSHFKRLVDSYREGFICQA